MTDQNPLSQILHKLLGRSQSRPTPLGQPVHTVELNERRSKVQSDLQATVYQYNGKLIISAISAIVETGPVIVLPEDAPAHEVGAAVCSRLAQFSPEMPDVRGTTQDDWAAYKASKAKSGKQFRSTALYGRVHTYKHGLVFQSYPLSFEGPSLFAGSEISLAASPADIGEAVRRVFRAAAELRDAGSFQSVARPQ